ncbi:hypothetical protein OAG36_00685 [bacterium]|nr:hypothetical protein [bacterium]
MTPTKCECTCAGSCSLMGWNGVPRKMGEVKYKQCQDSQFFDVFYAEREKYAKNREVREEEKKNRPVREPKPKKQKKKRVPPKPQSGVGTTFRKLLDEVLNNSWIPKFGVKKIPNCTCGALEREMNKMGPIGCRDNIDDLVERILKNTTANLVTAPAVRIQARSLINKAIDQNTEDPKVDMPKKMRWSYGITTVPQRKDDLFPATLESLQKSGFDQPHLFVDNCKRPSDYDKYDLLMTTRYPRVKTAAHWSLSMLELYMREPAADRYAIFQDDFVTYLNLKNYLEKCTYEPKTYWNLYTFPSNQKLNVEDKLGWYDSNQKGKGAVAIVMDRETVTALFSYHKFVTRCEDVARGTRSIDGGIVNCLKILGWKELVHNPSLVYHTGKFSSMGNKPQKQTISFQGENFDCLTLLEDEIKV